ncbi:hypothetical protein J2Y60_003683 [Arcicella sp. BE140]|uniref:hypothetical protein n=2 Tax=Arcicella TaxID=217140 RepID=UPI0028547ED7|nr:hypothetical protein [Arcicella sp. BE140]MDR6813471.1 hypothetical protein [Arcicella sp. BE140]
MQHEYLESRQLYAYFVTFEYSSNTTLYVSSELREVHKQQIENFQFSFDASFDGLTKS